VVADPPGKAEEGASLSDPELLRSKLGPVVLGAKRELIVVSPYFVPREAGVGLFRQLRDKGVRILVVTNSLASTDVTAVHAGYARYRKELLKMGVEIWEMRAKNTLGSLRRLKLGLSRSSLHSKAFVVDREKLFVGSFNWDPRSVEINTEMGVVLDSEKLAQEAIDAIEASALDQVFQVRLGSEGQIEWVVHIDGTEVVYSDEPETSLGQRFAAKFYALLPIEDHL